MKYLRIALLGVLAVLFPLVPGCDIFQHNTQEVKLAVSGAASDQGVVDAIVTIAPAEDLPAWIPCGERDLTPEECLDDYAERSSSPSSFYIGEYVSSTDVGGEVSLVLDSITHCIIALGLGSEGRILCPLCCGDPPLDQVTGLDFYVRVETDGATEILTVEFTPGNTVSGEFFEVTVVSIGEPVPVDDDTPSAGGDEP